MKKVKIQYIHQDGDTRIEDYGASIFYAVLREGDLFQDMEIIQYIWFPPPANSCWQSPTADRQEQIEMLKGLMKPYFDDVV